MRCIHMCAIFVGLAVAGVLGHGAVISQPGPTPLPSTASPSAPVPTGPPATPTATPEPVYLPLMLRERCPKRLRADLVFAIDKSASTLTAARDAAILILGWLEFADGDQAAAIAFGEDAELLQPLTGDRGAVAEALGGIRPEPGSCLSCGIEAATREIQSERRHPGSVQVLVVMFGADATTRPVLDALVAAENAKLEGVQVVAIWLGQGAHEDLLVRLASHPTLALVNPTAEQLAEILDPRRACPEYPFWPRRSWFAASHVRLTATAPSPCAPALLPENGPRPRQRGGATARGRA